MAKTAAALIIGNEILTGKVAEQNIFVMAREPRQRARAGAPGLRLVGHRLVAVLSAILCIVGGMSMAAVEGFLSSQELAVQAFVLSLKFTACLHVALLPGVYCAAKLMLRCAAVWRVPGTPALRANR